MHPRQMTIAKIGIRSQKKAKSENEIFCISINKDVTILIFQKEVDEYRG